MEVRELIWASNTLLELSQQMKLIHEKNSCFARIACLAHTKKHLIAIGRRYKRRSVTMLAESERQRRLRED